MTVLQRLFLLEAPVLTAFNPKKRCPFQFVRDDKMIPYPAQQFMAKRAGTTVVEVPGSHAIYVSNPKAVAALIEQAASGVK